MSEMASIKMTKSEGKQTSKSKRQIFYGTFIHSRSLTELEVRSDMYVFVDEEGVIVRIVGSGAEDKGMDEVLEELGWSGGEYEFHEGDARKDGGNSFYFPGFVGMFFLFEREREGGV